MDALEKKYGPALLDRFKWVAGTSTGHSFILIVALFTKDQSSIRKNEIKFISQVQ